MAPTKSIDFARHMIQGIGQAIKGTRYHLTVTPEFDRTASVETVRYILENRTADGVIITHTGARDRRVQLLMDHDFPFVSHGRTEFFTPHAFHDFHSEEFAELAVERLAAQGLPRPDADRSATTAPTTTTTSSRTFDRATARLGVAAG